MLELFRNVGIGAGNVEAGVGIVERLLKNGEAVRIDESSLELFVCEVGQCHCADSSKVSQVQLICPAGDQAQEYGGGRKAGNLGFGICKLD